MLISPEHDVVRVLSASSTLQTDLSHFALWVFGQSSSAQLLAKVVEPLFKLKTDVGADIVGRDLLGRVLL